MLQVGWLVHLNSQLDLQLAVMTALRHGHLMQLRCFGPVGGGVQNHLMTKAEDRGH